MKYRIVKRCDMYASYYVVQYKFFIWWLVAKVRGPNHFYELENAKDEVVALSKKNSCKEEVIEEYQD